jgi:hypothetical protein
MSVKCQYSGDHFLRGERAVEFVSGSALLESGVSEKAAVKQCGHFSVCPGCGRRLKLRKGLLSTRYWMLPQHNKEGAK